MRAVTVLTARILVCASKVLTFLQGLAGTVVFPALEKRLGLVRAGSWSIWLELMCLIPAVVAFFVSPAPSGQRGAAWNACLMFVGIQLSRIGLWSFDLAQMK
jgi:iron-regulated transporter 1